MTETTPVSAAEQAQPAQAVEGGAPKGGHGPTHYTGDTTTLFGRTLPMPVYTVVYIVLGVLTVIEVALAEIVPRGWLTIPLMLLASLGKAALVVWFYMHLNSDSRIFAVTLLVPVIMVSIATLFLMIVPVGY